MLSIPLEMLCKTEDPFTLLPHCLSLFILTFDFSSSLLLSLWLYKRTWRQVLRHGALWRPREIRWRGRWEGGSGWGILVIPWLIHVNVWQNPLQWCEVIILQLIKINEKKKKKNLASRTQQDSNLEVLGFHLLSHLAFWIKSSSLPQHLISGIHWPVMWWAEWTCTL